MKLKVYTYVWTMEDIFIYETAVDLCIIVYEEEYLII